MYITDKFAFVEVPKTGSTYIDQVMTDMLDGEKIGKHNYPSSDLLQSDRTFVGSIRNPFDWYVSLWAYGCKVKERSGPYQRTMSYKPFRLKGYGLDKSFLFGSRAYAKYLIKGPFANRDAWKSAYSDGSNSDNFKSWIELLFNSGQGYLYNPIFAQTRLSEFIGLYTFRYLWLCCRNREELLGRNCPADIDELAAWEQKNCYVKRFLKMENMSDDLSSLFIDFDYVLTNEQTDRIRKNKRRNSSDRARAIDEYYDEKILKIIVSREKLIFDKFSYRAII